MGNNSAGRVLLVDDELNALKVLSAILKEEGYEVFQAQDVAGAQKVLGLNEIETVITDLKMPGQDGMHLFEYISVRHPDVPVVFLTAYGSVDSAVSAITQGAFYYFIKPPDYKKLKSILSRAVEQHRLKKEVEALKSKLEIGQKTERIIGKTPGMLRIFETINAVKDSVSSVLICGETGTGKEAIARSLHYQSTRRDKPFIAVNCAAMPGGLLESELFGYEKGAFTGASTRRIGRFEESADGTIFLDEIGELEMALQAKLLRVLQEKEIERLGSNRKIRVNFRLICSTNRDLSREIKSGNFREDLYYRVHVVRINLPPLRERKDDIPLLTSAFLREYCVRENKALEIASDVMELFQLYHWPGNIRQLKNVIERAAVLAKGSIITARELSDEVRQFALGRAVTGSVVKPLRELEEAAIRSALLECRGNKSRVAEMLGISRKSLYKRLSEMEV
ncbi:MAG: sigma-54-dependent Fis family transcriptional regulator [Deltaproteobacteria bacterium]|nr:sigma-54-dependent Fis family transcriptional regulator [Deltaproteobacteria bacterium]TLN03607.1 MAG: sigma-54-dependent Fis family transcriptional regulator [bacterium]